MYEKVSPRESRAIIKEKPGRLLHSPAIEEEAFYRLRKYPGQIKENVHSAIVRLPRKVAYLLHQKPGYVSPAVESFYLRDPIALRPLRSKDPSGLKFPPGDFVTASVRFTRVGYAQLKSQDFPAPSLWVGTLPSSGDRTAYERAVMGMKLTCGFEMLLSDPQNRDRTSVREMKMILEDIDTGDDELPSNEEIEKSWSKEEDDEKWLDISFEDLDRELRGRDKGADGEPKGGDFGDTNAQENLQRIVARFEEFLKDSSAGFEGADFIDDFASDSGDDNDDDDDDDDDEDDDHDDDEELSRMMKESLGLNSKHGDLSMGLNSGRIEELDTSSEEDGVEEIQELSNQMEAELRDTGALDLNNSPPKKATNKQMQSKGKNKEASGPSNSDEEGGLGNIEEEEEEGNTNINLIKNMLESIEGQAGGSGPAGNMLSMMGLPLPRGDMQ